MRILFLINSLGVGGAETQIVSIASEFQRMGHDILIVTLKKDLRLLSKLDEGVEHLCLEMTGINKFSSAFLHFRTLVNEWKPDIIHANLFQANILSRVIKFLKPMLGVVNTTHCNYAEMGANYNAYRWYRYTKSFVNYHSAVSQEAYDLLKQYGSINADKSGVIFNAVNLNLFSPLESYNSPSIFRWITVGRLVKVKGFDVLLEAAKALKNSFPNFQIDIAGEGKMKAELTEKIIRFGLEDQVKLLGRVQNIPELLTNYHGYVLSSHSEGLPMSIIEAMATGLPIAATSVGELPEIFEKTQGAFLSPPGDPGALASFMVKMMEMSAEKRAGLGQRNLEYARSAFDQKEVCNTWLSLYSSLSAK